MLGAGVRRNVGHVQRIVLRGRELHAASGRTQRLEQRLSGGFVARHRVKMHLVETKILLVMANQRKHDVHFIIIITVARRFHNLRDETVQAEIIHERLTQFIVSPRNRILVTTVHFVEPHRRFRTVHLQQLFRIVLVAVRLNPLDRDFLYGATPIQIFLFENRQRILERRVLRHHGESDTIDHAPNAIVQILPVHRVEQISHGVRHTGLRRARNTLLIIVGTLGTHLIQNCRIVHSHNIFSYQLKRVIEIFQVFRRCLFDCFRHGIVVFLDGRAVFNHLRD